MGSPGWRGVRKPAVKAGARGGGGRGGRRRAAVAAAGRPPAALSRAPRLSAPAARCLRQARAGGRAAGGCGEEGRREERRGAGGEQEEKGKEQMENRAVQLLPRRPDFAQELQTVFSPRSGTRRRAQVGWFFSVYWPECRARIILGVELQSGLCVGWCPELFRCPPWKVPRGTRNARVHQASSSRHDPALPWNTFLFCRVSLSEVSLTKHGLRAERRGPLAQAVPAVVGVHTADQHLVDAHPVLQFACTSCLLPQTVLSGIILTGILRNR